MKPIRVLILSLTVLCMPGAQAKRSAPVEVAPVRSGQMEYRAPTGHMGYVEAWDTGRNARLWERQIYVVVRNPELEGDVQDVFISSLTLRDGTLRITNERGSEFRLDPETLEVKLEKGRVAEWFK